MAGGFNWNTKDACFLGKELTFAGGDHENGYDTGASRYRLDSREFGGRRAFAIVYESFKITSIFDRSLNLLLLARGRFWPRRDLVCLVSTVLKCRCLIPPPCALDCTVLTSDRVFSSVLRTHIQVTGMRTKT